MSGGIFCQENKGKYQKINLNRTFNEEIQMTASDYNGMRFLSFDLTPLSTQDSATFLKFHRSPGINDMRFIVFGGKYYLVYFNASGVIHVINSNITAVIDEKVNLALNIDSVLGLQFYINGFLTGTDSGETLPVNLSSGSFVFGNDSGTANRRASCVIENFKSYSISRSASDILDTVNTIPNANESGLIDCFPFLEEQGLTVTGIKGNTGTIITNNAGGVNYVNNTMRELI